MMSDDVLQAAPAGSRWVVLHTRPRCEKKVGEVCRSRGGRIYLPLRRRVHKYGARLRQTFSPLFSGYVFAVVDDAQASYLKQNRYVANFLDVVGEGQLLGQLRQIQLAIDAGRDLDVLPYLEVGKTVRVAQGPLKGLDGIVTRIKGQTRIVLNVDMIRESVSVEVDSAWLEPV